MKKIFFSIVIFIIICVGLYAFATRTKAAITDKTKINIIQLQAQVAELQKQLSTATNNPTLSQATNTNNWCYTFTKNLKYKTTEYAIGALQAALKFEGLLNVSKLTTYFGQSTRNAVVAFQEKYKNDILAPYGLIKGTGNVGAATLKKLNQLYGCSNNTVVKTNPPIDTNKNHISNTTPNQTSIAKKQELSICDKAQDQSRKDICYYDIAIANQDPSICAKIQDPLERGACYAEKKDPSICDKAQDPYGKEECYKNVAKAKQDTSICDKLQDKEESYSCYIDVAVEKQDMSICDKISKQYDMTYLCYGDVAKAKQDTSICDKIPEQYYNWLLPSVPIKWICYGNVAKAKQDSFICGKIKEENIKQNCYNIDFSLASKDASIKKGMEYLRKAAEMAYDTAGNYGTACTSADAIRNATRILSDIAASGGTTTCNVASDNKSYAVQSTLATDTTTYYCVDSAGFIGTSKTNLGSATVCPIR